MSDTVFIYDTTPARRYTARRYPRSLADKLKIARRLDEFRPLHRRAAGPAQPKDVEFFNAVRTMDFSSTPKSPLFGLTRRKDTRPEDDPNLRALLDAGAPVCTRCRQKLDLHVRDVLVADLKKIWR